MVLMAIWTSMEVMAMTSSLEDSDPMTSKVAKVTMSFMDLNLIEEISS
jgi:hypothetical protein